MFEVERRNILSVIALQFYCIIGLVPLMSDGAFSLQKTKMTLTINSIFRAGFPGGFSCNYKVQRDVVEIKDDEQLC